MKAAVIGESGLEIRDAPIPRPKSIEVLVKVRAAGLNRADLINGDGALSRIAWRRRGGCWAGMGGRSH